MSRDYLNIGCTPASEDCQQVGTTSYDPVMARKECEAYREQLRRQFGPEPEGARLAVKSFPHDFGTYLEVVCYFDDNFEDAVDYAFKCEGKASDTWDDAARAELGIVEPDQAEINRLNFEDFGERLARTYNPEME